MYYQSSATPNDPSEPDAERLRTLLDNLSNLKGKLQSFTVIDELDQPIGEIRDLILDSGHQLNLVISQIDRPDQSAVLLNGRRIKKVSVQTQSVFVDITQADLQLLPEYSPSQQASPPSVPTSAPSPGSPDWAATLQSSALEDLSAEPFANSDLGSPDFAADAASTVDNFSFDEESSSQPNDDLMDWSQEAVETSDFETSGFDIFDDEMDLSESLNLTTTNDLDWGDLTGLAQPSEPDSMLSDFALENVSQTSDPDLKMPEPSLDLSEELINFDFGTEAEALTTPSGDEFSASLSELSLSGLDDLDLANLENVTEPSNLEDSSLEIFSTQASSLENFTWDNLESSDRPDPPPISLDLATEDAFAEQLANLDLGSDLAEENLANFDFGAIEPSDTTSLSVESDPLSLEDLSDLDLQLPDSQLELSSSFEMDFPNPEPASSSEISLQELSETQPEMELGQLEVELPEFSLNDVDPEASTSPPEIEAPLEANLDNLDLSFASGFPPDEGIAISDEITFEDEVALEDNLTFGEEVGFGDELTETSNSLSNSTIEEFNSLSGWEIEPVTSELQDLQGLELDSITNLPDPYLTESIPEEITSLADLNFSSLEGVERTPDFQMDALAMPDHPAETLMDQPFDLSLPSEEESLLSLSNLDLNLSETFLSAGETADLSGSLADSSLPTSEPQELFSPGAAVGGIAAGAALTGFMAYQGESSPAMDDASALTDLPEFTDQRFEQTAMLSDINRSETTMPVSDSRASSETVDEIVPLLEERLRVEYQRRKVGEITVRKKIETRMIQVPVRYEKLVIEQVGSEQKLLAEVDLSGGVLDNVELPAVEGPAVVSGEFKSPNTASYVLDAIAKTLQHRCKNIRIEIELEDGNLQKAYQEWLNQCSQM